MKQINLIWDADGTLIDSYDSIIFQIVQTNEHFCIKYDKEFIKEYITKTSCSDFYRYVADKEGINYDELWNYHNYQAKIDLSLIAPMPGVLDVLIKSKEKGINNYIYTHRGLSIKQVLKQLNIENYFTEVVNMENGFKRKPSGEAIQYLIDKYSMDRNNTYYVGDRLIDMQCAKDAGVNALFFHSYKKLILEKSDYDFKIEDYSEIWKVLE